MALGVAPVEQRFENPGVLLGERLRGVYRLLAEHGDQLFPDDYFADLCKASRLGRPTVPARVLATVMVLQAQEGLSDQEAWRPFGVRPALAGGGGGGRRLCGVSSDGAGRPAEPAAGFGAAEAVLGGHQ